MAETAAAVHGGDAAAGDARAVAGNEDGERAREGQRSGARSRCAPAAAPLRPSSPTQIRRPLRFRARSAPLRICHLRGRTAPATRVAMRRPRCRNQVRARALRSRRATTRSAGAAASAASPPRRARDRGGRAARSAAARTNKRWARDAASARASPRSAVASAVFASPRRSCDGGQRVEHARIVLGGARRSLRQSERAIEVATERGGVPGDPVLHLPRVGRRGERRLVDAQRGREAPVRLEDRRGGGRERRGQHALPEASPSSIRAAADACRPECDSTAATRSATSASGGCRSRDAALC